MLSLGAQLTFGITYHRDAVPQRVAFGNARAATQDHQDMSNSTASSDHLIEPSPEAGAADAALLREVAALIVASLNLEVDPQQIGSADPLYGEGLGLDSIDMLEVALVVSKQYGFQMRANDESNVAIFGSLQSLVDHIAAHRTQ